MEYKIFKELSETEQDQLEIKIAILINGRDGIKDKVKDIMLNTYEDLIISNEVLNPFRYEYSFLSLIEKLKNKAII